MISFTSFPSLRIDDHYHGSHLHQPEVAEDALMDLDDDGELLGTGGSKLTFPGESLTSSQSYMRYVEFMGTRRLLVS
jgi:exosome complex component RRP4